MSSTSEPAIGPNSLSDERFRSRWRSVSARTRLVVILVVGVAVTLAVGFLVSWPVAPAVGWSAAAATFDLWVWFTISRMSATQTAEHATREDPSRGATDVLVLCAAVVSLAAVGVVIVAANDAKGAAAGLLAGAAILSVALSWVLVHTLFTLRYALLYYSGKPGGIDFNQDELPRYTDFAYLSFTIGMTYQVSDTDLKTHAIRASALRQGLLSYLFGAFILATVINLIAGLSSGG